MAQEYAKFPAVAILGPRQSGKTTLAKLVFPQHTVLSFDIDTVRVFAEEEPERFLKTYDNEYGLIFDEFYYVPRLISYTKHAIDHKERRPGYFIRTGSENYLANKAIKESLAGRIGILNLFSLSLEELLENNLLPETLDAAIFKGGYPRLFQEDLTTKGYYSSYIQTYVERDVIKDVRHDYFVTFKNFVQICAGRIGQTVNIESLCNEIGIASQTVHHWLSILEANYIIFFLQPHTKSYEKRLVKKRKLYFFDTGLACSLVGISALEILAFSPFRGPFFECLIIADLYKQYANRGALKVPLYFWRDRSGYEVDCIIDEAAHLFPIEIKASQSFSPFFLKGITY